MAHTIPYKLDQKCYENLHEDSCTISIRCLVKCCENPYDLSSILIKCHTDSYTILIWILMTFDRGTYKDSDKKSYQNLMRNLITSHKNSYKILE